MKKVLLLVLALVLVIGTMAGCGKTSENTPSGGTSAPSGTSSTTPTPGGTDSTSKPAASGLVSKVGDTASFGTYNGQPIEWQTLAVDTSDKEHQIALLISKDGLALMPFNPVEGEEITWEKATLRIWLNGEFYNTAFTDEQKAKILETDISTPANAESGAVDTSKTKDKIFILSADECKQYFANDEAMAASYGGEDVAWWTRTPGNDLSGRVCTYASGGGLYMTGNQNHTADGAAVRPAIWVDITPEDENGGTAATASADGTSTFDAWPDNAFTQQLPKPDDRSFMVCEVDYNDKETVETVRMMRFHYHWSDDDAQAYGQALIDFGYRAIFNGNAESGYKFYGERNGYWVTVDNNYDDGTGIYTIYISGE